MLGQPGVTPTASERRARAGTTAANMMMRRLAALVALVAATTNAQMQKSREVRSHEEYHKKRQDQLNRKAQSRKNALKKGGTQSKTLHELRMKKQHKNRAKKSRSGVPAFDSDRVYCVQARADAPPSS